MDGKFITLEGIDGAGKSTHLASLADLVRAHGHTVRTTREPGGTELGERLRALLLDSAQVMHLETEAMLMFAARREHLDKVIEPALSKGEWVICDRFTDATFAYQGAGRGADWARLQILEAWVQRGRQPDLTLVFDVSPALGRARAARIKQPDRFEREQDDFFERVRAGYLRRAAEASSRIRVIDAGASIEHVSAQLAALMDTICR